MPRPKPKRTEATEDYSDENDIIIPSLISDEKYTGEVFAIALNPHEGAPGLKFPNYSLSRLVIKDNQVVYIKHSDPMMAAEIEIKLENKISKHMQRLRKTWPSGFKFV